MKLTRRALLASTALLLLPDYASAWPHHGHPAGGGACPMGSSFPDGCSGAPSGTAQFPTALSGYSVRPPWNVAGVDYYVGPDSGVTLVNITTISNTYQTGAVSFSGATTLNMSAVPAFVAPGMFVKSLGQGQVPNNTTVVSKTSTTVLLSAALTNDVFGNTNISFSTVNGVWADATGTAPVPPQIIITGTGTVLNGIDASLSGPWFVVPSGVNITVQNCKFVGALAALGGEPPMVDAWTNDNTGLTVKNCSFSNASPNTASNPQLKTGKGDNVIRYCRFTAIGNDAINVDSGHNTPGVSTCDTRYCLFDNANQGGAGHTDCIQTINSGQGSINGLWALFNTWIQPASMAGGTGGCNSFMRCGDALTTVNSNPECGWNTILLQSGGGSGVGPDVAKIFDINPGSVTHTLINPWIHDNYLDLTGADFNIYGNALYATGVDNPAAFNNLLVKTLPGNLQGAVWSRAPISAGSPFLGAGGLADNAADPNVTRAPASPPAAPGISGNSLVGSTFAINGTGMASVAYKSGDSATGTYLTNLQLLDTTAVGLWPAQLIATTTANSAGNWSFSVTLSVGSHSMSVRQVDLVGNASALTTPIIAVV